MKILKEKHQNQQPNAQNHGAELHPGKTVLVGVRLDQQSRELLTWSLVKVAAPGDHVVALHVVPSSSADDPAALLAVVKDFESVLAVYDGFCHLRQIELKLKVCRASSLRRALVHHAKACSASALVLGAVHHSIRSSPVAIAKHCAKKLHADCAVLAVSNGKVVFQRDSGRLAHGAGDWEGFHAAGAQAMIDESKWNCSACAPAIIPGRRSAERRSRHDREEEPLFLNSESCSTLATLLIEDEVKPGWPLLRKAVAASDKTACPPEPTKMSVVQWAMRLPSRHSSSHLVHPDHKLQKLDANVSTHKLETDFGVKDEDMKLQEKLESIRAKYSPVCRLFTYQELMRATSGFSPDNLVGNGGSSRVYRGRLSSGKELAVKILKPSEDSLQEFASEVEIITSLHHKNVVTLYGFCFEDGNLILVYNLLSRGSLENILHDKEKNTVLRWPERYKVAIGVAEALGYLHGDDGCQQVIHRDVKSSNILLADNFEPQLCDFGLAQWASNSTSIVTCNDVAGTFGYLAPEYFMHGKVTEKIDVYAFGVVLLELLSGRKPVCTGCPKGQQSLVMWARTILQGGKVKELLDPSFGDKYDNDQMERMVLASSLCIRRSARSRPCIAVVLKLLQGDDEIFKWAKSEVDSSEEFDEEVSNPDSNIQSYIKLALLDIDDETASVSSSMDHTIDFISSNTSLEEYLQGRWSRSSSFNN